jgi:hypothetical protein
MNRGTTFIVTDYNINDILLDPEDYLNDECDDIHLMRVAFRDGYNVDIFIGCDADGYYLYIEDDVHAAYEYAKAGLSLGQIFDDLCYIAQNKKEF